MSWLRELRPPVANWMGMAMKFDYEAAVTRRLFGVVALPFADLANPMAKYGRERESERNAREVPSVCDPAAAPAHRAPALGEREGRKGGPLPVRGIW